MAKTLAPWRYFWRGAAVPSSVTVPFAISCVCGQIVTGRRRQEHQVLPCPTCRAEVFVLPRSPWPTVLAKSAKISNPAVVPKRRPRWLFPLLAFGAMLFLIGTLWISISWWLASSGLYSQTALLPVAEWDTLAQTHQKKAEEYLSLGHFALALEQLDALDALQRQHQKAWVPPLWLAHQRHELALYVDLLQPSLEELLSEAIDLPEAEWQKQFQKRYQGKAVLLDTLVTRLAEGGLSHSYKLQAAHQEGQLDLAGLPFLKALPPGKTKRVLFGARLHNISRSQPGLWLIELDVASGLLLTIPQAAAISCPGLGDPETRILLAEQKQQALK